MLYGQYTWYYFIYIISSNNPVTIITHGVQIRKLKHREVTLPAQGHTVLRDFEAKEESPQTHTHFQLFGSFRCFESYDYMANGFAIPPHGVLCLTWS